MDTPDNTTQHAVKTRADVDGNAKHAEHAKHALINGPDGLRTLEIHHRSVGRGDATNRTMLTGEIAGSSVVQEIHRTRSVFDDNPSHWFGSDSDGTVSTAGSTPPCTAIERKKPERSVQRAVRKPVPLAKTGRKARTVRVARPGQNPLLAYSAKVDSSNIRLEQERGTDFVRTMEKRRKEQGFDVNEQLVSHRAQTKRLLGQESSWIEGA